MKEKVYKRGRIDIGKGLKRENEMRYRVLFEGANDGIFLMKGGRFVDCNKKFLSIFACTKRQVIGQTPYHFSPLYQPDGRPSKEKAIEKGRAAISGKPQRFEWRHIRSDGTPFDAEINLKRVKVGDNIYLLQAILRDISEQKRQKRG
jgi:PAS domain S-box-containing protein